ncbi:MAG: hypothetical protein ACOH1T_04975 [Microbacteriaceae bacterium]
MKRLALVLLAVTLTACTASPTPAPAPSVPPVAPEEYTVPWVIDQSWELFHEQYPDVPRPTVDLVRVIPQSEWATIMDECLSGEGFADATATPEGGLTRSSTAKEQEYQLATYVCSARYPIDPLFYAPLTHEKIGLVYDYFVSDLAVCLAAEGHPTKPAPLSRDEFVDSWEGVPLWSPYGDIAVDKIGTAEFTRLLGVCPELPSDAVLHAVP